MDKVQLLKDIKRESLQIKRKIDRVQDKEEKQQLLRSYDHLVRILDI